MASQTEVKSEHARNVILSYENNVYFVNRVNVRLQEGAEQIKAVFHARKLADKEHQDLEVEINQNIYDLLVEYAKLDKFDLILVLHLAGNESKWCLMSENWLEQQNSEKHKVGYIV